MSDAIAPAGTSVAPADSRTRAVMESVAEASLDAKPSLGSAKRSFANRLRPPGRELFRTGSRSEMRGESSRRELWNVSKKTIHPRWFRKHHKRVPQLRKSSMRCKRMVHDKRGVPLKKCIWGVPLGKCIYCGTDTRLHINDVPVCPFCAKELLAGRNPRNREQATSPRIPNQASS
jgi:hypothetical protein